MTMKFENKLISLGNVELDIATNEKDGTKHVGAVVIDGEPITPSNRFWLSLYSKFGLNQSFFKFFSYDEVFKRLAEKNANSTVRVTVERNVETGDSRLLAVSSPDKSFLVYDDMMEVISQYSSDSPRIAYHNGVLTSTHQPIVGTNQLSIGGDSFVKQYELHAPIDGYGNPNFFLGVLRQVCSNGAIGLAKAFKTALQLGDAGNLKHVLKRAMEGFMNEEGYAVMHRRFEAAQKSYASLQEQCGLYNLLVSVQNDRRLRESHLTSSPSIPMGDAENPIGRLLNAYENMTGRPYEIYRKDPNDMTFKRRRSMPVQCKVYDLINFATEVSTHFVGPEAARRLQGWVGEILSGEYDLEGSYDRFTEFKDMFIAPAN